MATSSPVFATPDESGRQLYQVAVGRLVDVIAKSKDGKWAWVRTADDSPAYIPLAAMTLVEAAKSAPSSSIASSHPPPTLTDTASNPVEAAKPNPSSPIADGEPAPATPQAAPTLVEQAKAAPSSTAESEQPAPELPDELAGPAQAITTGVLKVDGRRISLAGLHGEGGEYREQFQELIEAKGGTLTCHRHGRQYTCRFPDGNDVGRTVLYNGAARVGAGASGDYREQARSAQEGRRGIWQ